MVAQRIRLAACTVNWGVRGIEGVILEMPVIGALEYFPVDVVHSAHSLCNQIIKIIINPPRCSHRKDTLKNNHSLGRNLL